MSLPYCGRPTSWPPLACRAVGRSFPDTAVTEHSPHTTVDAGEAPARAPTQRSADEPDKRQSTSAAPAVGTRFSSEEIHDNVLQAADAELERPMAALFWSALAAGLVIGW